VASETERRVKLAEASIKNLTGRDRITCRRLYENAWEFEPSHSLWLQTNYLPEIAGRDHGIWRRIRVVPWLTTFRPAEGQGHADLDAVLAAEAPGILRWAVEGCLAWQREGLQEPEAVIRATLAYRSQEDALSRFATDTGFTFDPALSVSVADVNTAFDEWAGAEGVKLSRRDFADWLKDNGASKSQPRTAAGTREWVWQGAGFRVKTESGTAGTAYSHTFPREQSIEKSSENGSASSATALTYPCTRCGLHRFPAPATLCFACRKAGEEAA
jgi:putative DNA primase/helicase